MEPSKLVGISGINYELGDPVEFVANSCEGDSSVNGPVSRELTTYRMVNEGMGDKTIASMRRSIQDALIKPSDVDAVIFCTSANAKMISNDRHNVAHLLRGTSCSNAYPIGLTLSTCAGFQTGLQISESLLRDAAFSNILLVLVEGFSPDCQTFVGQNSRDTPSYVCSDGVASCVISNKPEAEYLLLSVALGVNVGLVEPSQKEGDEDRVIEYLDLLRATYSESLRKASVSGEQIRKYFMGNYFRPVVDSFCDALRIGSNLLFRDNICRVGHCYSADNLINLKDYVTHHGRARGDCFALLGTGVGQIGSSILRAT